MTVAIQTATDSAQATRLEQRLKEHREEVARLREEFGDPAAALDKFILEHFDVEAFLPEERSKPDEYRAIWEEDDDSDDR